MKIEIRMRHGGQLDFETAATAEQLRELLKQEDEILDLTDSKGNRALIPIHAISFIVIPHEREMRVGFARA
ncbi:DUF3107 family protein [Scrofimicrobium sp. R131]|uniref:DUF3107 family protein n=1 Tax=Scrofimicrobium appendicitidis TaxID=3079930 RepID=A0AAU7V9D5_9ACTO